MNVEEINNLVDETLADTEKNHNTLPDVLSSIDGMSGKMYRYFINRLIFNWKNCKFLEIGCWKGSTSIPAIYKNQHSLSDYWLIDNWSQFGGPKGDFLNNFKSICEIEPKIFDIDCFSVSPESLNINNVDVYMYDGDHEPRDHELAVTHFKHVMNNNFLMIIDDWNWDKVKVSTEKAIQDSNLKINKKWTFLTDRNATSETWWNGMCMFSLSRLDI